MELRSRMRDFVLIDALDGSDHTTIPGAVRIPDAGSAGDFTDRVQDKVVEALLRATGNNRNAALVFFCQGARCWESYNATLRAKHGGFTNVYWYRGGLSAWNEAGYSLVP
jgi:PQQ-dependent catabolism-associated CXXCW motif protein